jgi:hypothetical protein
MLKGALVLVLTGVKVNTEWALPDDPSPKASSTKRPSPTVM